MNQMKMSLFGECVGQKLIVQNIKSKQQIFTSQCYLNNGATNSYKNIQTIFTQDMQQYIGTPITQFLPIFSYPPQYITKYKYCRKNLQ